MTILNRNELVQRVYELLDNSSDPRAQFELMKELEKHPELKTMLEREQKFREFIKAGILRKKPSDALIASLKQKIESKILV